MTKKIESHYRELLQKFGDSPEAAQYSNRESQYRRFAALARIGDLRGKRVLDFGCGTGTLFDYLVSVGQTPAVYQGVDVVPEFFEIAREKIPHGHFCHPDEMEEDVRFDYLFVSGVFNNRKHGNRKFWQETIRRLYAQCDIGVAFNMMSTYVDYRDKSLFYEDPCRVFSFVKKQLSPYVTLRHDYLAKENSVAFEFNVYVYRKPVDLLTPR